MLWLHVAKYFPPQLCKHSNTVTTSMNPLVHVYGHVCFSWQQTIEVSVICLIATTSCKLLQFIDTKRSVQNKRTSRWKVFILSWFLPARVLSGWDGGEGREPRPILQQENVTLGVNLFSAMAIIRVLNYWHWTRQWVGEGQTSSCAGKKPRPRMIQLDCSLTQLLVHWYYPNFYLWV